MSRVGSPSILRGGAAPKTSDGAGVELRKGYRFRFVSLAARGHREATFDLYATDGERRTWVCANVTKDEARQVRDLIDGWLAS